MNKIEELKYSIGRFDHYFDSINNKGNLYLTVNTFLLGGIIVGYAALVDDQICDKNWKELTLLINIILTNAIALIYTILAIMPYTGSRNRSSSFLFYGDIADMTITKWRSYVDGYTAAKHEDDLIMQAHELSCGLNKKFKRLKVATIFFGVELGLLIIAGLYLLICKSSS